MNEIEVIKFNKQNIPVAYESPERTDDKYVHYGYNNLYPDWLLGLYNESPIHSAIINNKANYIIGDGLKSKEGKDVDFKVNSSDNVKELLNKIVKDYLISSAFAVEMIFNKIGEVIEYHHIPINRIRMNKSKTKFWYNEDWEISRKTVQYDRYVQGLIDNTTSKIFYFDGYNPSTNKTYPQPEYNGALKSIVTDLEIRSFNLNNIKNHFSVASVITFFQGSNINDDVKRKILKDLTDSYTGSEGSKFIVDFQSPQGNPAEVKQLSANDWSDAYTAVGKKTLEDIMIAHTVTNPMLFGVKTEGQLGGATELETSYEIFKNTYIRVKRDELESALKEMFASNASIPDDLVFGDKPLFNAKISDTMKEKVFTINEIRKEAGLQPLANGDRLMNEVAPQPEAMEEVVEEVKKKSRSLTDADYELVKDMGLLADDFDILDEADSFEQFSFGLVDDIAGYVVENDIKGLTLTELKDLINKEKQLKISEKRLQSILNDLNDSGVIKVDVTDGKIQITPNKTADIPDSDAVTVMYKYEKRPEISGPDILSTSRGFCVKLIENNRLYTRTDIQMMSELFGYNIYEFCGGFYYNPETETTTAHCRHQWKAYSVKRKTK